MTREAHTLALSPELGTPLQQAGCPSPQPARRPPACPSRAGQPSCQLLAGPIVQQCQEMAAAAQAGKGRARKGGGVGRAGRRLPTQTPLPGWACLPASGGRHRHTYQAFPHLSSQDGIPRGRACHCPACWWPSQAASRKGFMVTCLPAECLETVPGGRVLLKWCCSASPSHTLAGNAAPLGLETVGDGDHRPGRPWTLACALAGREAFASACFVGVS